MVQPFTGSLPAVSVTVAWWPPFQSLTTLYSIRSQASACAGLAATTAAVPAASAPQAAATAMSRRVRMTGMRSPPLVGWSAPPQPDGGLAPEYRH
jgi:hypothetical protein